MSRVAVIGAGLSGLACGRSLVGAGHEVQVFDKARGPGGRTATRRTEPGPRFDHGAQYFTVRDERFQAQVDAWAEARIVAPWEPRIGVRENGRLSAKAGGPTRWVGVPGMNALAKALEEPLEVQYEAAVTGLRRENGGWHLEGVEAGGFDVVVSSLPPVQAKALAAGHGDAAAVAESVRMTPCWAVMLSFVRPLDVDYDGIFVNEGPLSWVARNSSKPGRNETETWVVHGGSEWSAKNLELQRHEAEDRLLPVFFEAVDTEPVQTSFHAAHRWRYSAPEQARDIGCWWDPELGLGLTGDWLNGARIEGAFLSGLRMADAILAA